MKVALVLSCILTVSLAVPANDLKQGLLELLRKELEAEKPEPTGLTVMRREIAALKTKANNFLEKRGLDTEASDFAQDVLSVAKRLSVAGIRQQTMKSCKVSDSEYLKGTYADAQKYVDGGSGHDFADADECFKDAVADALIHSIKNPMTGKPAPSADRNPEACGGDYGKDPATIDEEYCRHTENLALQ